MLRKTSLVVAGVAALLAAGGGAGAAAPAAEIRFSSPRQIDNPYLPLTKFSRCELRGQEEGTRERVVRRLLDRTMPFEFDGRTVRAVVIEDRAFEEGELVERTLDYFAQADDGTVYYVGEDVDNYRNGKVVNHEGSWMYGRDTSKLGVAMPAGPRVGDRWRFEDVPGITVESDRVVSKLSRVRVRGKTYRDVIRVRERLHPQKEIEYKLYARGTGLIREVPPDGQVDLVGCRPR
jgi:hypothetical protein